MLKFVSIVLLASFILTPLAELSAFAGTVKDVHHQFYNLSDEVFKKQRAYLESELKDHKDKERAAEILAELDAAQKALREEYALEFKRWKAWPAIGEKNAMQNAAQLRELFQDNLEKLEQSYAEMNLEGKASPELLDRIRQLETSNRKILTELMITVSRVKGIDGVDPFQLGILSMLPVFGLLSAVYLTIHNNLSSMSAAGLGFVLLFLTGQMKNHLHAYFRETTQARGGERVFYSFFRGLKAPMQKPNLVGTSNEDLFNWAFDLPYALSRKYCTHLLSSPEKIRILEAEKQKIIDAEFEEEAMESVVQAKPTMKIDD